MRKRSAGREPKATEESGVEPQKTATKLGSIIASYRLDMAAAAENLLYLAAGQAGREGNPFRQLDEQLQLEFYVSALLYLTYGDRYEIMPGYREDENGMPVWRSMADAEDICVNGNGFTWILEVSMTREAAEQFNSGTVSCMRHLEAHRSERNYLSFVAPEVFPETGEFYSTGIAMLAVDEMQKEELSSCTYYMKAYDIWSFLQVTAAEANLQDMENWKAEMDGKICRLFHDAEGRMKTAGTQDKVTDDKVKVMESLFGCIPADMTLEESKEERISRI